MEYYYEGEHINDPLGIGKNYDAEDITQMLKDMEEFSVSDSIDIDMHKVISERIIWKKEGDI